MDQEKVQAIPDWPQPVKSVKELQRFLGLQISTGGSFRTSVSSQTPQFHAPSETQVSVLELRSLSRQQEAQRGLMHCSHPLTYKTPTPMHNGSGCLHHRHGSSAVSIPQRVSLTPPLCLLLQEAFTSGAKLRYCSCSPLNWRWRNGGIDWKELNTPLRSSLTTKNWNIYIYAFSRRFYPKRLTVHSGYTCFFSMCVPWESNPQPLRC